MKKTKTKENYWQLAFFITLILWISSLIILFLCFNQQADEISKSYQSLTSAPTAVVTNTLTPKISLDDQNIFMVEVETYRNEIKDDQLISTFQIRNLNKNIDVKEIIYWTDIMSPCDAKAVEFSEFIEVPTDEINQFTFFMFKDENGNESQIYAASHQPIFQCSQLTEPGASE